jgi:peroxiredoxin
MADNQQSSSMSASLPQSAADTNPIKSGKVPSGLSLISLSGEKTSLDDLIHSKPTILIFYRGGWCPYCNAHLAHLQSIAGKLNEIGYQIIAISPDQAADLAATVQKHSLSYSLFTDSGMNVSKAFGLAYQVDSKTLTMMSGFGIDLPTRTGLHPALLPVPAAYVLDTSGNIHYAYANPDYKTRVDASELLAEAEKALKSN